MSAIFWTKAGEGLTVAEAFTSLSIISIASQPLVMVLVSVMTAFGALGSFTRLQAFLQMEEKKDGRELITSAPAKLAEPSLRQNTDIDLGPLTRTPNESENSSGPILTIEDGTFAVGEDVEVLKNIDLSIQRKTLTAIVGRVGCGKSSLLKAMTGELRIRTGRIIIRTNSVAYCDQTPWLQNITIRDNIIGQSPLDEDWLATVIRACALDEDCSVFPQKDHSIVGSGGVALSGGQKQRVVSAPGLETLCSNDP